MATVFNFAQYLVLEEVFNLTAQEPMLSTKKKSVIWLILLIHSLIHKQ